MATLTVEGRQGLIILLLGTLAVGGAYLLAGTAAKTALVAALLVGGAVVAFLRTEMSIYFLIMAMLLSPELSVAQTPGMPLQRPITLRIDDLLIAIIAATWFLKNAFYKELNLIRSTPLNSAIWIYSFSCVLSTMVGVLQGNVRPAAGTLYVLKYLEYFFIFWMVINTTRDERQIRRYLALMLAVAVIVSCVAISEIPSGRRVSAPFEGEKGEPNTLGGYLILVLAVTVGVALASAQYRKFLVVAGGICLIPFLYTLSRASYLGFVPTFLILPWLLRKRMVTLLALLGLLFVVAFPRFLPKPVLDRIEFTFSQAPQKSQVMVWGRRLDTSTSARYHAFAASLDAYMEKPLIGWGVTGWGFIDSQYFRGLVETGLLGLATFLYLIYRIIRMANDTRRFFRGTNPFYEGLTCGFIAATAGLLVHAIGSNTFIIVRVMEPYWMICAIVFLLPGLAQQGSKPAGTQAAGLQG